MYSVLTYIFMEGGAFNQIVFNGRWRENVQFNHGFLKWMDYTNRSSLVISLYCRKRECNKPKFIFHQD